MSTRRNIFGAILVVVGLLLLLNSLNILGFTLTEIISHLLPLGLIVLGIWLIVRRRRLDEFHEVHEAPPPPPPGGPSPSSFAQSQAAASAETISQPAGGEQARFSETPHAADPSGRIRYSKFLGDVFVDCNGLNLQNVQVSGGISDVEIKLHGGTLSDGLNRMVVSGFVGDLRLLVPADMEVFIHCSNSWVISTCWGGRPRGWATTSMPRRPVTARRRSACMSQPTVLSATSG